jgi:mRNA interferase ChpB
MRRGEVYMVSLHPGLGCRPVVIVSPDEFNAATRFPVTLPITTGDAFSSRNGFAVILRGTKTAGVVRCDQPRVADIRSSNKVETLPPDLMDEILAKVATIFE